MSVTSRRPIKSDEDRHSLSFGPEEKMSATAIAIRPKGDDECEGGEEEDSRGLRKRGRLTTRRVSAVGILISLLLLVSFTVWSHWTTPEAFLRPPSPLTIVSILHRMQNPKSEVDWEMPTSDLVTLGAITTWFKLVPPASIVLYARSNQVCEYVMSAFKGVTCYYHIECLGIDSFPDVSCVLRHLMSQVNTELIAYVNPDVALDRGLTNTASYVHKQARAVSNTRSWMLVGTRTDVSLTLLSLQGYADSRFCERLAGEAQSRGVLHNTHAIDYFVLSKALLSKLIQANFPAFLAGAGQWTNHLLATALLDPSIRVIDATTTISAVRISSIGKANELEPELEKNAAHPSIGLFERYEVSDNAIVHNERLSASHLGVKQRIGDVRYVPFEMDGECPDACVIVAKANGIPATMQAFTARVNPQGYLAVLTVNSGYLDLAMNWICWVQRINFTNFILLAEDKYSAERLSSSSVTVITRPHAVQQKAAAEYGSAEFQATMTYRTEFFLEILNAGYHFMTADMDSIWLSDPFDQVDVNADLSGQTHKKTQISGGLVIVRSSEAGIAFWRKVIACQRGNAKFLAEHKPGEYEPSLYTEQYCINELSYKQPPPPAFTKTLLDPWLFPDGKSFFEELQPQHAGIVPVIIHNNWIRGASSKLQRQKEWNLLSTEANYTACKPLPSPPLPDFHSSVVTSRTGMELIVRVMAHSNQPGLKKLLEELNAAEWGKLDGEVTLQIDIDRHETNLESDKLDEIVNHDSHYMHLVEIANGFRWKHGPSTILRKHKRKGRMTQFVGSWPVELDSRQILLILDEECSISSLLPEFVQTMVKHYYLNNQYDPRLASITLEPEDAIIGDTYWNRYPTRSPYTQLARDYVNPPLMYRYQTMSPLAQVVFPGAMAQFIAWAKYRSIDLTSALPPATTNAQGTPCIPLVRTNEWFYPLSRHPNQIAPGVLREGALGLPNADDIFRESIYEPEEVWWAWWLRWMYEHGLYSLSLNLPEQRSFVTHAVGKLARFLPEEVKERRLNTQLVRFNDWGQLRHALEPLSSLPLFETHFRPISRSSLLSVLPNLLPRYVRHQCYQISEFEMEQIGRLSVEERKMAEDAVRFNVNQKQRNKNALSDVMRAQQKKATEQKLREQEEEALKQQPRIKLEGG